MVRGGRKRRECRGRGQISRERQCKNDEKGQSNEGSERSELRGRGSRGGARVREVTRGGARGKKEKGRDRRRPCGFG